jgi:hypothetical protein
MPAIGITLGDCDLNGLSTAELKQVTKTCGEPSTMDSDGLTQCSIKVIASNKKMLPSEDHGYGTPMYKVLKVLPE